ncbi:hypothetical protein PUN28_003329 [Cardiocondyla obscurior]|uniref:Uncharacterized protein n=1 Tax=Cardiocondyla obscurior TaxID=286306 RepID=A0AAW2GLG6_9HYME
MTHLIPSRDPARSFVLWTYSEKHEYDNKACARTRTINIGSDERIDATTPRVEAASAGQLARLVRDLGVRFGATTPLPRGPAQPGQHDQPFASGTASWSTLRAGITLASFCNRVKADGSQQRPH